MVQQMLKKNMQNNLEVEDNTDTLRLKLKQILIKDMNLSTKLQEEQFLENIYLL